jgi:serine/threonine protein phosphatase PrpC
MTANEKLLPGQSPVPPRHGDFSGNIDLDGLEVQAVSVQGARRYQEDRFHAETLDLPAGKAKHFLAAIFSAAAKKTDGNEAGCTATGVTLSKDLKLDVAFVGDSPVVVFTRDPATGDITARKLTRDHHAREPSERKRIISEGGHVARNGRVDGSLELSRAFGDGGYIGVSRQPEFAAADLARDVAAGKEIYLCLSSDGLYATLEPEDYIALLKSALAAGKSGSLADILCAHAYEKGSGDNITVLVAKVPADLRSGLFLAICDGHGGHETAQQAIDSFKADVALRKSGPGPKP